MAKAKAEPFTPDEKAALKRMMQHAFSTIAFDLLAGGGSMPRAEVVEVTLDANYLESFNRNPGQPELLKRFRALSYPAQKALARETFTFSRYTL